MSTRRHLNQVRAVVGLILISLIAIRSFWKVFQFHAQAESLYHQHTNPVEPDIHLVQQLESIRRILANRTIVGYRQVFPDPQSKFDLFRFYQTQYFLAPIVVDSRITHPIVLVDCGSDQTLNNLVTNSHYHVIQRFGQGLALLETQAP